MDDVHLTITGLAGAFTALKVVGFAAGSFFMYKAVKARSAGRTVDAIWFALVALFSSDKCCKLYRIGCRIPARSG